MKPSSKIILASNSPRRKELLESIRIPFEVKTVSFEEIFPEELDPSKVAEYLAVEKNKAHREHFEDQIIITADTVVVFSNSILGKPKDEKEAIKTLKLLGGKLHQVITVLNQKL